MTDLIYIFIGLTFLESNKFTNKQARLLAIGSDKRSGLFQNAQITSPSLTVPIPYPSPQSHNLPPFSHVFLSEIITSIFGVNSNF